MTSKNNSMLLIFEPNQDTPRIHPWYKFGPNATNICQVIEFISENGKFSCSRKIGQGSPSSYLTKTLLIYIHGISVGPMLLIFVEIPCLKAQIANFHFEIEPQDLTK